MDMDIDEEYVRPPDEVIRERLVNDPTYTYTDDITNADLNDVLEESMLEYTFSEIERLEKQERENKENEEKKNRKKSIECFLTKLNKLSTIDPIANEIKTYIIPFIDNYINYNIIDDEHRWDDTIHSKIKNFLKTFRILAHEKDILHKIIKLHCLELV
jgi:polyribonucleotide nucleotidyltransferase